MSEDVKLKPCPFCGSDDLIHRPANETHSDVGYVKCNNCLSSASVKAWSTRTNPAAVKGVVEAAQAISYQKQEVGTVHRSYWYALRDALKAIKDTT